ncbi:MAG: cyclic nucleotide-binding domain-containing protein [Rubripirellula sp.]|nr:cyclic nucleotide-binding domain-containing protein [Rubripirellula sp.]
MLSDKTEMALRQCGFLRDVDEEHLSRFVQLAMPVDFVAGELILREGEAAKNVYVILSGSASLELCASGIGCRRLMTLSDGDLLSWSAVLEQTRLTATVRAISPVHGVVIDGQELLQICEDDPAFGFAFMRRVALATVNRLTAARMQLLDVFGTQMPTTPEVNSGASSITTTVDPCERGQI